MDCTVHGILQARRAEWVAFPFSRGSSQPRERTQVSLSAGGFFTCEPQGEALPYRGARTIQWSDACVTTLHLTSDFESLVLYKPSVRVAIIFIMQDLCMYHLIQYFEKKSKN